MGMRAPKEREANQVACCNLPGTPPGWESREARRGRQWDGSPHGDAGSQGEGGTLGTHGQNLFWDGPATGEGRRAKEREADQVACCNLSGTPPGWEGREARRGRRSECLGSALLAPFDAANNIPRLTSSQYRAAFFFTKVNSSFSLHNPTLLVGLSPKKKAPGFSRLPPRLQLATLYFAGPTRRYCT